MSIPSPYRGPGRAHDEVVEDEFELHVTHAAESILQMQERGWKLAKVERIQGPRDQPDPWWATKEWRGSHVRLTFRRPA